MNLVAYRDLYDMGTGFELFRQTTKTYAEGPEVEEVWDWDGDGDLVARGRLALEEAAADGDGDVESTETFEWEDERIVRSIATDGSPLYVTWTYEDGALVKVEGFPSETVPPNTVPDYREIWTLDEDDLVVEHRVSTRAGTVVTTTARDDEGRPVEIRAGENLEKMEYEGDRMIRHEIRATYDTTVYEFQFDCGS